MKNPVMYLIANKGLGMSPGKLAAQCSHAAVRSVFESAKWNPVAHQDFSHVQDWLANGETKIVLEARDAEHLLLAQRYIENRGYKTSLVIDEGRTEVPPLSATCLGIELVDKADPHVTMTFETFQTYKDGSRTGLVPPKDAQEISDNSYSASFWNWLARNF